MGDNRHDRAQKQEWTETTEPTIDTPKCIFPPPLVCILLLKPIDPPNCNVPPTGDRTARIRHGIRCRWTHPPHWLADLLHHDWLRLIDETSTRLQNTAFFVGVKCMERRRREYEQGEQGESTSKASKDRVRARRARRALNSKPNMKTNKAPVGFRV